MLQNASLHQGLLLAGSPALLANMNLAGSTESAGAVMVLMIMRGGQPKRFFESEWLQMMTMVLMIMIMIQGLVVDNSG